ncbi:LPXTG cell wall anchor domain-containing protein [Suipraeoptans intestinalis]|uniref:LPXTG cell wall anchor domain-containing protein n=1 Tax=Suipraeoptans intestinalis TaxID=2606628 RepID=UPI0023EFE5FC|nr:LPXTG cell wall anchor domain-containing protein [Suipraeoptans intestinalis]MDD7769584.1 LPXTG cell wall anchor domain-containing protein [Suipraeoptans intestinalis]
MRNKKLAKKLFAAVLTFALVGGVVTPLVNVRAEEGTPAAGTEATAPAAENAAATENDAATGAEAAPAAENDAAAPVAENNAVAPVAANGQNATELPGDLLVGEDTEHDKVYETTKDAEVAFTGALYVSKVKEQMKSIEQQIGVPAAAFPMIQLSDVKTEFVATLLLPEEMEFVNPKGTLVEGGAFEATDVIVDAGKKVVTVKMQLKDAATINTYQKLRDAIMGTPDVLKVVVTGAKFTADAKPDTNYTVVGRVDGTMSAKATLYGNQMPFDFEWEAVQHTDGKDVVASDDKTIQFTLKYVEKAPEPQPEPQPEPSVTPTPQEDKKPAAETKKTTKKVVKEKKAMAPKTGDHANLPLYGGLAVVSILAVGGVVAAKKKRG